MAAKVKWTRTAPPRSRVPSSHYDEVVAELKKKPGKTAEVNRVAREGHSDSYTVPGYQALKRRGCNVFQRSVDGDLVLYASWPES